MEHFAAFMLLVGCSGNLTRCEELPVPVPAYESLADCHADIALAIRFANSDKRKVFGACTAIDDVAFEQDAAIEWNVRRDGRLTVAFVPKHSAPQLLAAR